MVVNADRITMSKRHLFLEVQQHDTSLAKISMQQETLGVATLSDSHFRTHYYK